MFKFAIIINHVGYQYYKFSATSAELLSIRTLIEKRSRNSSAK